MRQTPSDCCNRPNGSSGIPATRRARSLSKAATPSAFGTASHALESDKRGRTACLALGPPRAADGARHRRTGSLPRADRGLRGCAGAAGCDRRGLARARSGRVERRQGDSAVLAFGRTNAIVRTAVPGRWIRRTGAADQSLAEPSRRLIVGQFGVWRPSVVPDSTEDRA